MRSFDCPTCGNLLHFDNSVCTVCDTRVGFDPKALDLVATSGEGKSGRFRCANAESAGCNWLAAEDTGPFCLSCGLNATIPAISDPLQHRRWSDVERAKRRLVYDLLRLGLAPFPITSPSHGLTFKILVGQEFGGEGKVTMGHEHGLITIDATEADAHMREKRREELGEYYRTLLGHMRHEAGHYFWDRLAELPGFLDAVRATFGDERADYGEALQRHYHQGPPDNWQETHVSAYATAHAWEDWAETFAHFLHMTDGLETADRAIVGAVGALRGVKASSPISDRASLEAAIDRWIQISIFMNSMNRGLGHRDFYPFVLGPAVRDKLAFIHEWLGRLADAQ